MGSDLSPYDSHLPPVGSLAYRFPALSLLAFLPTPWDPTNHIFVVVVGLA